MNLSALFAVAVPLAWLLPNHYPPWPSAWLDGMVMGLLALALLCLPSRGWLPRPWGAFTLVAAASVAVQWAAGRIGFGGDALLVGVYLWAFAAALLLGTTLPGVRAGARSSALEILAVVMVVAAVVSVGIALVQWTAAFPMGIYGADLPPRERPFGNLAQPNHLASALFFGLCGVGLLRERALFGKAGSRVIALFLLLGMVMTVSRTAWLQLGLLMLVLAVWGRRSGSRVGAGEVAVGGLFFVLLTMVWPSLNELLLLRPGRPALEAIAGGNGRWPLWAAMMDAVGREPWWGWGWQQLVLAQQAVALDRPPLLAHYERGHNLIVDLLVWTGIPVAATLTGLIAWGAVRACSSLCEPRALWLLLLAGGFGIHALLEYPHDYAYFLAPLGLALGALDALARPRAAASGAPWAQRGVGLAAGVLLGVIASEYLEAEQNHRLLRLESARIGTTRIESAPPDLKLLSQLQAFLEFTRVEARPGMTPAELAWMRKVSERFAYPPAMLRYALAAGLNGDPQAAQRTLATLCAIQLPVHCRQGREAWLSAQGRYPVLAAIPFP